MANPPLLPVQRRVPFLAVQTARLRCRDQLTRQDTSRAILRATDPWVQLAKMANIETALKEEQRRTRRIRRCTQGRRKEYPKQVMGKFCGVKVPCLKWEKGRFHHVETETFEAVLIPMTDDKINRKRWIGCACSPRVTMMMVGRKGWLQIYLQRP